MMISNRRQFLRATGLSAAMPLLPSLLPRGAEAAAPPVRRKFVALLSKNGQRQEHWTPLQPATQNVAANVRELSLEAFRSTGISPTLGPAFAPLLPKLTYLKGLDVPMTVGHNDGAMLGHFGGSSPVATIDQVLARSSKFYGGDIPGMRALLMTTGGFGGSGSFDLVAGRHTRMPAYENAQAAYTRMFFGATETERLRHRRVIDRVMAEYARLKPNPRLSAFDRQTLEGHVSLMSELQTRLAKQRAITCEVPPEPRKAASPAEKVVTATDNTMDLAVIALSCGVTQVVGIHMNDVPGVTPNDWHGWSHTPEITKQPPLLDVNKWLAENAVLKLLQKMDAVMEPNGKTLLDNSVVFWGNEISSGMGHFNENMPVLLAGSAGGWLRTGMMLDYSQYERPEVAVDNAGSKSRVGRPYNQLLSTLLQAMGLDRADYERPGRASYGELLSQDLGRNERYAAMRAEVGDPLPRLRA